MNFTDYSSCSPRPAWLDLSSKVSYHWCRCHHGRWRWPSSTAAWRQRLLRRRQRRPRLTAAAWTTAPTSSADFRVVAVLERNRTRFVTHANIRWENYHPRLQVFFSAVHGYFTEYAVQRSPSWCQACASISHLKYIVFNMSRISVHDLLCTIAAHGLLKNEPHKTAKQWNNFYRAALNAGPSSYE